MVCSLNKFCREVLFHFEHFTFVFFNFSRLLIFRLGGIVGVVGVVLCVCVFRLIYLSLGARKSQRRPIMEAPAPSSYSRAIPIKDNAQNLSNLSQSLGGTIYGTTPGGTRIIYDRNALLLMRNSPLSKTPPVDMPMIPGVTGPATGHKQPAHPHNDKPNINNAAKPKDKKPTKVEEDKGEMFEME